MSKNKEINEYVGNKIKKFRCEKNITQKELAEYLNTTSQTISRYENGILETNQDILFALADYFKISINDFFPPIEGINNTEKSLDQYDILFSKYKDLNEDDKKFIATYIEEKKKQIDKENNNE